MEVVPASQVDSTRRMMEEFAGSHGAVTADLEAFLQGAYLWMINKVESAVVTSRGGSDLPGKYGGPGRGAEDTGGVGIGEINPALGQTINIRSNCNRRGPMATNLVIHVVHSDE